LDEQPFRVETFDECEVDVTMTTGNTAAVKRNLNFKTKLTKICFTISKFLAREVKLKIYLFLLISTQSLYGDFG
jgi:hypothetical protein